MIDKDIFYSIGERLVYRADKALSLMISYRIFPIEALDAAEAIIKIGNKLKNEHLEDTMVLEIKVDDYLELLGKSFKHLRNVLLEASKSALTLKGFLEDREWVMDSKNEKSISLKHIKLQEVQFQNDMSLQNWVDLDRVGNSIRSIMKSKVILEALKSDELGDEFREQLIKARKAVIDIEEGLLNRLENIDRHLSYLKKLLFLLREEQIRLKTDDEVSLSG